ncbi:MAG: polymer-forming cytoskeletal protein [Patescibacteria group bacterium]
MKHLKWALGGLLLAVVPVFAWVSIAGAQRFSNTIEEGQTVNSSLYSAGKNIEINGIVNGDIFCAGQTIKIDAVVHGDVICAGQDVTISGKVDGDVRLAGQLVTIKGDVGQSATVAAMTFSLDAGTKVGRDLTATGDTVNLKGAIGRDVVAAGSTLIFNGPVGRNVKADGSKVTLKNSARITGNFTYTSDNKAEVIKGAVVEGKTHRPESAKPDKGRSFNVAFYLFALFGLLVIGLSIAYFFPQFLRKNSSHIKDGFAKTLLVGLIASFLVPMVSLGLIVSVIGIPLVVFLFLAWLFGAALSGPITGYYVGRLIFRDKKKHPLLIMLVGGAVLTTAYFLPLAGILFLMLAYWLGFGALLLSLKEHVKPYQAAPNKA